MTSLHRNRFTVVALVVLVAASGCTGLGAQSNPDATTTTTRTTTATTTAPTTTAAPTTTDDTPAYGTEFVYVSKLENQSEYTEWPDNQSVHFQNLSDARQEAFLTAFEGDRAKFGPDEPNPFAFNDKSRPRVVKYEGTWYYVRVAIV